MTWYKQPLQMQKDILNVLVYQEPITLSISCIIPELSLHYFCSVRQITTHILI
ncbi:hypothetical protein WN51_09968 [Melipona quadrifasciata]|uniref:Uncharacterized protein n=1 Tax=Melipona quadrifasciata TaxID=166423 RepID=A0A0M9ADG7_9HYME|nr:hypothetical protein WN51_09968 [Melipona quadrifasciata]